MPGFDVRYYYGGFLPNALEGKGELKNTDSSILRRLWVKIIMKFNLIERNNQVELLKSSLKEERVQYVLAEYGLTGVKMIPICKSLNIPLIVHFHGYDASIHDLLQANKKGYEALFKDAAAVVAVSRAMEQKLLSLGCDAAKLHYNTYGPNDAFFELKPHFSRKLLVSVGRFVDKKAPYYTILAFKEVLRKHPDAQLVIGGEGPLLNTCQNLIGYLNIKEHVMLPGVIEPEKFRSYLQDAVAFVQHSVTASNGDMEGTPVAVLEASAAGIPVISTYHAGIPDVIEHEKTGLLIQEHDVDAMAACMIKLLDDVAYAQKLGAAGRENIKQHFSMEKHLKKLSEIIINSSGG